MSISFQAHARMMVKGRARPVPVYRVQSATARPDKVRRVHGLKAKRIGWGGELRQLEDVALRLQRNEGTLLSALTRQGPTIVCIEDLYWADPSSLALIRFNLTGMGLLHFLRGDIHACRKTGEQLLRFGEAKGDVRPFSEGYLLMGAARMALGDFVQAESLLSKAIDGSVDPIYSLNARFYLSLILRRGSWGFSTIIKNAGFLIRTIPMASRLAERYLRDAIEIGTQIGTRLRLAQAYLDLGLLYGHKKRFNHAREYVARSIDLLDPCGADMLLVEARTALDGLPR